MKRNEHLKTLSWEHHHGLVSAFRLQQGLNNGTAKDTLRDYILYIWENDLDFHFWKEEQIIQPSLVKTEDGKKIVEQMTSEHKTFRNLIKTLKTKQHKIEHIRFFADILNKHIRFEERRLFPFIEKESSEKALEKIGDFLEEHYTPSCNEWQPRFWVNSGNE